MLKRKKRPFKPTPRTLLFALLDVAGMIVLAAGAAFLARGGPVFNPTFPSNSGEAVACVIVGLAVMLFAAAQIVKEMVKQLPAEEDPQ